MSIETEPSGKAKLAASAARPAEWGLALSMGAAVAESAGAAGEPGWIPIITGVLSLIIRLLPLIWK